MALRPFIALGVEPAFQRRQLFVDKSL